MREAATGSVILYALNNAGSHANILNRTRRSLYLLRPVTAAQVDPLPLFAKTSELSCNLPKFK